MRLKPLATVAVAALAVTAFAACSDDDDDDTPDGTELPTDTGGGDTGVATTLPLTTTS
jgi:hypothetical protein